MSKRNNRLATPDDNNNNDTSSYSMPTNDAASASLAEALELVLSRQRKSHRLLKQVSARIEALEQQQQQQQQQHATIHTHTHADDADVEQPSSVTVVPAAALTTCTSCFAEPWVHLWETAMGACGTHTDSAVMYSIVPEDVPTPVVVSMKTD